MFGRGVIATQYAWALEQAGHKTEFYVRPGRMAEYGDNVTLNIYDARKKWRGELLNENWKIKMREDLNADHDYDLIIVSVQHYHFKSAVDFLTDKIGKATILIFNNFWDEPQETAAKLPITQLVYGFPLAGGGFDGNGVLNGTLLGSVSIGTFGTEQTHRGIEVMDTFKTAGFKIKEYKDFRSYLFSHFVFNAVLHLENLKSADGLSMPDLFKTSGYWRNVILNAKELLPVLKARNVDLKANVELKLFNLPPFIISFLMRMVLEFLPPMKQILTSHSNLMELKSYCKDVLKTANDLNIALPRFEANKNLYQ